MPVYEWWCDLCQQKASLYQRGFSPSTPCCPHCGNNGLKRSFSTFYTRKTHEDIYDNILSDGQLVQGMLRNDPRALAEWNKRMSQGEKVAPEYEELVGRMERGELPAKQTEN